MCNLRTLNPFLSLRHWGLLQTKIMIENTCRLSIATGVCVDGGSNLWFVIIMCAPDVRRTLTHFEENICFTFLLAFAQTISRAIFQNVWNDFLPKTHVSGFFFFFFFLWGQNGTYFRRFFGAKFTHLGQGTSPHILHMWNPPDIVVGPGLVGGTLIIPISSIYGMHRYENFATKLWKKVLERGTFLKG